jgi:ribonuclease HI
MITIFTDGSSRGNPGPGGWGSVVVTDADVTELGGYEANTTNNRMEIMAAIGGLEKVSVHTQEKSEVILYSDSMYLINGITKWVRGWQAKGWITSQKEPVMNRDLWERLIGATADKKISWKQVGGHVGTVGNERCDQIATKFADSAGNLEKVNAELFSGALADYAIKNILDISVDHAADAKKSASKERSNTKAYSYVSRVEGVVQTHKTWAECEARVRGKSATRFKKAISAEDEKAIVAEFEKILS